MVSGCQRLSQVFRMSQDQGRPTGEAQGCTWKRPHTGRDKGHSTELSEGPGEAEFGTGWTGGGWMGPEGFNRTHSLLLTLSTYLPSSIRASAQAESMCSHEPSQCPGSCAGLRAQRESRRRPQRTREKSQM